MQNSKKKNEAEMMRFEAAVRQLKNTRQDVIELGPFAFQIGGKDTDPVDVAFMAVTHGNEVGGIRILAKLCESLEKFDYAKGLNIVVMLGNIDAVREDERFLERDLNRSFGRHAHDSIEDRRARFIEKILGRSKLLLDLHQTIEHSERPFFIFPFAKSSLLFAQAIDVDLPVVTHWQGGFSKDGMCTDEYLNSIGGVGISVEIGQNGVSEFKVGVGVSLCQSALCAARQFKSQGFGDSLREQEIYSWAEIIEFVGEGLALDPGWYNFKSVSAGQKLGSRQDGVVVAGSSGFMLFPKYLKSPDQKRPAELCRIIRRVQLDELPC